eukprot:tig00020675_g12625.t1
MLGAIPKGTLHYGIMVAASELLVPEAEGDMSKANSSQAAIVGAVTGALEVVVTNPINLVKFRLQRPELGYRGATDAVRKIYEMEGLSAFWKGSLWTVARNSVFNATMMAIFQHLTEDPRSPGGHRGSNSRAVFAGSVGGAVGSVASYPFEMLRCARQQNLCFRKEFLDQGPGRIFSGWFPGACRLVVTSSVTGWIIPRIGRCGEILAGGGEFLAAQAAARPGHEDAGLLAFFTGGGGGLSEADDG